MDKKKVEVKEKEKKEAPKAEVKKDYAKEIQEEMQKQILKMKPEERKQLIAEYNKNNAGICEIEDIEGLLSEDYVNETKKDFEDVVKEANGLTYTIADKEKALETAKFLKSWNAEKNEWHRAYWKGVIKFDEFITEQIKELEEDKEKSLVFDYNALIFLYQTMMQPSGVGLEAAKAMEAIDDQYNSVLNTIGSYVDKLSLYDKKAKLFQERWGLACNGFKMNVLVKNLEDYANVDLTNRN